jgi:hypothetical protein
MEAAAMAAVGDASSLALLQPPPQLPTAEESHRRAIIHIDIDRWAAKRRGAIVHTFGVYLWCENLVAMPMQLPYHCIDFTYTGPSFGRTR